MDSTFQDNGMLNPDMPIEKLHIHLGVIDEAEEYIARQAILWANRIAISALNKQPKWNREV